MTGNHANQPSLILLHKSWIQPPGTINVGSLFKPKRKPPKGKLTKGNIRVAKTDKLAPPSVKSRKGGVKRAAR